MTATMPETLMLTVDEAAEHLRVSRSRVYELIANGELEASDIAKAGSKRTRLRVPLESLKAFISTLPRVSPAA